MKKFCLIIILFILISNNNTNYASLYSKIIKNNDSIDKYRKGEITIKCVDKNGNILVNCPLSFNQISHDFIFAAHPMGKFNKYNDKYALFLKDIGINFSHILMTWGSIETELNKFNWGAIESYQNIQEQLKHGFKLMGALTLWWNRGSGLGYQFCPKYLESLNFDELKKSTYNHMYMLTKKYKDRISIWELNEQNLPWTNPLNLTWKQKLEICKSAISGIKDAHPEAKIIFTSTALPNEFNLPPSVNIDDKATGVQFPFFLKILSKYGIEFDFIGLEFYYSGKNTDGYMPPVLDVNALSDLIDLYSSFGKPIYIKELSAPSKQIEGTSSIKNPKNEEEQAEFLKQVYLMAFSKQLVKGIGWGYGVSDEDCFIFNGGILNKDLTPKKSYYALKELIATWTTNGTINTDKKGKCLFKGFAGEYLIIATAPDGRKINTKIHIFENQRNEYKLEF